MTIGSDVDLSIGCGYAGTKDRQSDGGAALMTGTKVDIPIMSAVSNMQGNTPLEEAIQQAMDVLGGVPFDDADRAYAARIQATLSDEDINAEYRQNGLAPRKDSPLCDYIVPPQSRGPAMMGSTDVADVSWAVPTVQARVATHAIGTPGHSWQITAQGKAGAAHKGRSEKMRSGSLFCMFIKSGRKKGL